MSGVRADTVDDESLRKRTRTCSGGVDKACQSKDLALIMGFAAIVQRDHWILAPVSFSNKSPVSQWYGPERP
jgi:hypothetical protein